MSDEEFEDPRGANSRWMKTDVNKVLTPNKGGVFRWKRSTPASVPESVQNNEKRAKVKITQKQDPPPPEVVELTDDEDNSETIDISDDSDKQSPSKNTSAANASIFSNTTLESSVEESSQTEIKVYDAPLTQAVVPEASVVKRATVFVGEKEKPRPKYIHEIRNDAPLPPGMPPVIAGVPVKFPVSPYRSQISVMNAVIKGCKGKEHCLLESPTGSGKTLALLCAALGWQESFEQSHLLDAAKKLRNHDPDDPSGLCQPGKSVDDWKAIEFDETKEANEKKIPKIYYGSRTHKQIEQVIREFRKTAYAHKNMTILSSREHTCIQSPVKGISKTQLCNNLLDPAKKTGGCEYYKENNKQAISCNSALSSCGLKTPWDIEDLVDLGKQEKACPYFAARALMAEADIIFCPYNYLIDPVIRETMKINLNGDVVIVDEAHNIESICRDVGSADFREDNLGEAIEDCKLVANLLVRNNESYKLLEQYISSMLKMIQEQQLPQSTNQYEDVTSACWTGEQTWTLFKMHKLGGPAFAEFEVACKIAVKDYNEVKEDIKESKMAGHQEEEYEYDEFGKMKKKKNKKKPAITFVTKKLLEELLSSLKNIQHAEYSKDYRCTISQSYHKDAKVKMEENKWTSGQGGRRLRTIKFMCMNSAIVFSQMARATRCVILASGTLSPTSTFESELGTKFVHKLHANHVVPRDQVYVRGIASGPKGTTLRATYKNVQMLPFKDDLGRLVLDVCQTVPHGVLCFFSSYSMMLSQIDRWKETDIWYELQQCKHIVQEPRSNNDLEDIMREFRDVIRETADREAACGINGALLFAVFRGKVAEGIDFSDNEARAVLTIGIPYAVQNDPQVKLKREYNDMHRNKGLLPGGEWYSVQAYRALNQALGRCIRHRNDWGAVLLVDERLMWPDSINYLPKWIREMRREGAIYDLKSELKEFVKEQKIRDSERANN
ncbi:Fanconi anemia group J protein homolog isoform X2 [Nasonia vitripennis]|nr:Fanconi anemia group J protein homolog isoform X2 [Nasonia vitripennis]XP_008203911.1 Fanconi anemia group J protein homolog isoform X2 [Nasonia vitripennis]